MRTTSWIAFGLTAPTDWLYSPRKPYAAASEVAARTSGITDATIAPNASSRIRNVAGIVNRSDPSSSSLMSSVMSRLMNVLLMTWTSAFGSAARVASTIAGTGTSFCSTIGRSPGMLPTTWTVVPSGEIRPDSGGTRNGSMTLSNVGCCAPSTDAVAAVRSATSSWTVAWKSGFVAAPAPPLMTTTIRSAGATGSPAPSTS